MQRVSKRTAELVLFPAQNVRPAPLASPEVCASAVRFTAGENPHHVMLPNPSTLLDISETAIAAAGLGKVERNTPRASPYVRRLQLHVPV